jgi:hypothetical protein
MDPIAIEVDEVMKQAEKLIAAPAIKSKYMHLLPKTIMQTLKNKLDRKSLPLDESNAQALAIIEATYQQYSSKKEKARILSQQARKALRDSSDKSPPNKFELSESNPDLSDGGDKSPDLSESNKFGGDKSEVTEKKAIKPKKERKPRVSESATLSPDSKQSKPEPLYMRPSLSPNSFVSGDSDTSDDEEEPDVFSHVLESMGISPNAFISDPSDKSGTNKFERDESKTDISGTNEFGSEREMPEFKAEMPPPYKPPEPNPRIRTSPTGTRRRMYPEMHSALRGII